MGFEDFRKKAKNFGIGAMMTAGVFSEGLSQNTTEAPPKNNPEKIEVAKTPIQETTKKFVNLYERMQGTGFDLGDMTQEEFLALPEEARRELFISWQTSRGAIPKEQAPVDGKTIEHISYTADTEEVFHVPDTRNESLAFNAWFREMVRLGNTGKNVVGPDGKTYLIVDGGNEKANELGNRPMASVAMDSIGTTTTKEHTITLESHKKIAKHEKENNQ